MAALAPLAVGRDRVLPAGGYLQVSEEIYLACTSGGPRLDPADAFVVNGAARLDLPHVQRKRGWRKHRHGPAHQAASGGEFHIRNRWLGAARLRDSFLRISR